MRSLAVVMLLAFVFVQEPDPPERLAPIAESLDRIEHAIEHLELSSDEDVLRMGVELQSELDGLRIAVDSLCRAEPSRYWQ